MNKLLKTSGLLILFFALSVLVCHAQAKPDFARDQAISLLTNLQGKFSWEIQKPSTGKVTRRGFKESVFKLDSLVLYTEEQFNDSDIEHLAIMGWDEKNSRFFSVGIYNIDMGPHVMYGLPVPESDIIMFAPNDSSKVILNIKSKDEYFWTYQNLESGQWVDRDMKITFKRVKQ